MKANQFSKLEALLELANNYPSPHNGQPMVVRATGAEQLEVYFQTSRGLSATPISYLFSFVTIGVFVRHLELCALALGHRLEVKLQLPKQAQLARKGRIKCATVSIRYGAAKPNKKLALTIETRQTSRKKYSDGLLAAEKVQVEKITQRYGLRHHFATQEQARQIIWLNQRAVFDDMFDPQVRRELDHWLRYDEREKHAKRDGLAFDCMELSGAALRFAVHHYRVLHWPIIAPLLQKYYLRTMQDASSVGYLTAPFQTEDQAYDIGRCLIDIWLNLTAAGHYLHPFGTVVSNKQAHRDFVNLVGLQHEARRQNYVVFIYRAGSSPRPVASDRLPVKDHLYNQVSA